MKKNILLILLSVLLVSTAYAKPHYGDRLIKGDLTVEGTITSQGDIAGPNFSDVISEAVTYTVGSGKDFETLTEALDWSTTVQTVGNGAVRLSLDDGTHLLPQPVQMEVSYGIKNSLTIASASGNKANCIISIDPTNEVAITYGILFSISNSGYLYTDNVTFDMDAGGYSYAANVVGFAVTSSAYFYNSSINNTFYAVTASNAGDVTFYNTVIDTSLTGIRCVTDSSIIFTSGSAVNNSTTGLQIFTGCSVIYNTLPSFSGNTTDYSIPLHEIQSDGAYMTDMDTYLTLEGAASATGLEAIDEGNGIGWAIIGREAANYGSVGLNAKDLSYSANDSVQGGATGGASFASGWDNTSSGDVSASFNDSNLSSGWGSFSTGWSTVASGDGSFTGGHDTLASGDYSQAFGVETIAGNIGAHAEGEGSEAHGYASHAEGFYTNVPVTASYAHAEGQETAVGAGAEAAHAEGYQSTASGIYSHAEGKGTIAQNPSQHSAGTYNVGTANDTIHETGIGANAGARANAFEIYDDGRIRAPALTPALHDDPSSLVTKEFVGGQTITEDTTKTVGAGQDFETLQEALDWATNVDTVGKGKITLTIDDGTHELNPPTSASDATAYIVLNQLILKSASETAANCIITYNNTNEVDTYTGMFTAAYGGYLSIADITIDPAASTYAYSNKAGILGASRGTVAITSVVIKNGRIGVSASENSNVFIYGSTIDNQSFAGAVIFSDGFIESSGPSSITNSTNGFYIDKGHAVVPGMTFSGNTTDATIPLNEVQQNGDYITDITTDLAFSGAPTIPEIITEDTTKTVGAGQDFTTLHEALTWATGVKSAGNAGLLLSVADGIHALPAPQIPAPYTFNSLNLTIQSTSGNKADCTITIDTAGETSLWPVIFKMNAGRLFVKNLTIDPALNGYAYADNTMFLAGYVGSDIQATTVDFKNHRQALILSGSIGYMAACSFDGVNFGVNINNQSYAGFNTCSFNNATNTAITANNNSTVEYSSSTFSGNTADYSITLNEVQPDGSLITDGGTVAHAGGASPTGLEAIDEGNGIGWVPIGRTPENYGTLGNGAFDLSYYASASILYGATGDRSFAVGQEIEASGFGAVAGGYRTHATNDYTTAFGYSSSASGYGAFAVNYAYAAGEYAFAANRQTQASGENAFASGNFTIASGQYATSVGVGTEAQGWADYSEGDQSIASGGWASHAEGYTTAASAWYAHAEGNATEASGQASHAEGTSTTAVGESAHAEGNETTANANYSHAEGNTTYAGGVASHTEGANTSASGIASHAEGNATEANADYSHAEGNTNTTNAESAHAEGHQTDAYGIASHTEGYDTYTGASYAHAEGNTTEANGEASHSEGFSTVANANYSHAEGNDTNAFGVGSHAEGYQTYAGGVASHAEGQGTTTSVDGAHVVGRYNIGYADSIVEVGIGTGDLDTKNAFDIKLNGAILAPDFTLAEIETAGDTALVTKEYVDSVIVDPTTTTITRTVGTGQDFTSLHDALVWATSIDTQGAGDVSLVLEDETFALPAPTSGQRMYNIGNSISISSSSGTKADCKITINPAGEVSGISSLFMLHEGGYLYLEALTIDPALNSFTYASSMNVITLLGESSVDVWDVDIENARDAVTAYGNNILTLDSMVLDSNNTAVRGVGNAHMTVVDSTISNNTTGVNAANSSKVLLDNVTFTTNTTDATLTLNEIQETGGYITNIANPLMLKDNPKWENKTPASQTASCTAGDHAWDASYLYVCTADDYWERVAIANW